MKTLLMVLVMGLGSILTGCPDDGRDGLDGWMGEDGEDGEDGEAGDAGPDGKDGEDGTIKAVYQGTLDAVTYDAVLELGLVDLDDLPVITAVVYRWGTVGYGYYPLDYAIMPNGDLKIYDEDGDYWNHYRVMVVE